MVVVEEPFVLKEGGESVWSGRFWEEEERGARRQPHFEKSDQAWQSASLCSKETVLAVVEKGP